ncbi:HAMP domain-containing histidine kinase [Vibrio genomosp. F10 str. 9ZC157]|uniref:histidine kinase n=1 Tax=Vibrio genomosp. F10 str. ZF-129 TaxID=1187848 RepID=A0A1E5BFI2_9VIBR|nr:HAMP domain-containing histidine kinase [Vibrio genomosp. F10]OEE34572.1 two-component sensor histidine kinase [Vibrio genomosp. F10 str. ZF-129]OEE93817.1 two-component sensor histidine kinase [Vibrio genomosp. F10 str. 9ZC157]
MVRYRLLILTSAPIVLTLISLIGITIYWSITYTWNAALVDVSERLGVANNSIALLQQKQAKAIESLSQSYDFRIGLNKTHSNGHFTSEQFTSWVESQRYRYDLDFLAFYPIDSAADSPNNKNLFPKSSTQQELDKKIFPIQSQSGVLPTAHTFFDRFSQQQLEAFGSDLSLYAQIPLVELSEIGESSQIKTDGLVSRSILPILDSNNQLVGYLDGGLLLNNSTILVDQIKELIYPNDTLDSRRPKGTVTVFLDDVRVSTNVPLDSDTEVGRAIGTRVSEEVKQAVLIDGQQWVDRAYVYDAWYITAYRPIKDSQDSVIGMLYTGYLIWPFFKEYMTNIIEVSLMTLALLLGSGYVVYRGSRDLFQPIERIHRVVKLIQLGKDKRIGELGLDEQHELAQLARQFDNMLDSLQQRKIEIEQAALQLEVKVKTRTASLEEKTAQLEHHITLLNQTRDKLIINEKLAALGELTAGIAHEINNPTAVILGNAELIKIELGDDAKKIEEEIDSILEQIDRIRNITRSLLQYSRQGGIQDEINWERVNPIIEESMTLVKTGANKRGITFIADLHARTSVEVNRHQFLQVLVNLQMNGIYSMNGQGTLTISSHDWYENEVLKGAVIQVADEGCGISPEHLKRIFDPFYTTKRDGTGLGLSVSQSIVSQSGGQIKVESALGKGSVFSVYLPKKDDNTHSVLLT